ncbi:MULTISPECIES: conjugal transfer protein TraS [Serratia]|uniref:conjugal transfer protein TraS n=1 Tax=Serratia TaxID=613 RepID=UPI002A5ACBA1|nr:MULTISPECIES: conjugal transfer protein TraS [Serratia]MDY0768562.1 conjugal transfer protein TraS [Serratia nevei]MED6027173.1 conjugal transfer protein TraS [Serratia marcescens]
MTITHKTIQEETRKLKSIFETGDVEIPSFWHCAWPGLLLVTWLVLWPLIAFGILSEPSEGIVIAIGFGGFLGFLVAIAIFNIRSLYLAIPSGFRNESKVFALVRNKVKYYLVIFVIVNFFVGCFAESSKAGSFLYTFVTIAVMVILSFIFAADIGRYRLSAFTSVLELIKSRKQGGE